MNPSALDYGSVNGHDRPPLRFDSGEALSQWIAASMATRGAITILEELLPEEATFVEQVTCRLTTKFKNLATDSLKQSDIVQKLVNSMEIIEVGDKRISIDEFIEFFTTTLDDVISKLLYVSKKAVAMIYGMEDAIKQLNEIETFSKNIQSITKRTHLLALNASIEASSAGEAGKGFNVVANEVKEVSRQIANISEQMNIRTRSITHCVMSGYDLLKDVATADMDSSMIAKTTLEDMLLGLREQTAKTKQIMADSSNTSKNVANTIQAMSVDLQFQDRNTQITQNLVDAFRQCDALLSNLQGDAKMTLEEHDKRDYLQHEKEMIDSVSSVIKLGEIRFKYLQALQKNGALSVGGALLNESHATSTDDVDLF